MISIPRSSGDGRSKAFERALFFTSRRGFGVHSSSFLWVHCIEGRSREELRDILGENTLAEPSAVSLGGARCSSVHLLWKVRFELFSCPLERWSGEGRSKWSRWNGEWVRSSVGL